MIFICTVCTKKFVNYKKNRPNRYCSHACLLVARRSGTFNPMAGKTHNSKTIEKMSASAKKRVIEKPHTIPDWTDRKHTADTRKKMMEDRGGDIDRTKGNYRIGYVNVHKWLRKRRQATGVCEHCDEVTNTHMANKTGKYLYDIDDWLELCPKCHRKYDDANNLKNVYRGDVL